MDRKTTSPLDGDNLGQIVFRGENASQAVVDYLDIGGQIVDDTAGAHKGKMTVRAADNGTMQAVMEASRNEVAAYTSGTIFSIKSDNTATISRTDTVTISSSENGSAAARY